MEYIETPPDPDLGPIHQVGNITTFSAADNSPPDTFIDCGRAVFRVHFLYIRAWVQHPASEILMPPLGDGIRYKLNARSRVGLHSQSVFLLPEHAGLTGQEPNIIEIDTLGRLIALTYGHPMRCNSLDELRRVYDFAVHCNGVLWLAAAFQTALAKRPYRDFWRMSRNEQVLAVVLAERMGAHLMYHDLLVRLAGIRETVTNPEMNYLQYKLGEASFAKLEILYKERLKRLREAQGLAGGLADHICLWSEAQPSRTDYSDHGAMKQLRATQRASLKALGDPDGARDLDFMRQFENALSDVHRSLKGILATSSELYNFYKKCHQHAKLHGRNALALDPFNFSASLTAIMNHYETAKAVNLLLDKIILEQAVPAEQVMPTDVNYVD